MSIHRSIEETERHAHPVLPDAGEYRVARCRIDDDFTVVGKTTLQLTLVREGAGGERVLAFGNVTYKEPLFIALRDATGLYVMDTGHLGWASNQRIEVGDEDDGSAMFWAESVEDITEE